MRCNEDAWDTDGGQWGVWWKATGTHTIHRVIEHMRSFENPFELTLDDLQEAIRLTVEEHGAIDIRTTNEGQPPNYTPMMMFCKGELKSVTKSTDYSQEPK